MKITRHFLGWDGPLVGKVCEHLLPAGFSQPADLSSHLIIVPTRQAGRRLREALASRCAQFGSALLAPRVVTSNFFVEMQSAGDRVASASDVAVAWARILSRVDPEDFPAVFPGVVSHRDFRWALSMGELFQKLREQLAEGGFRITELLERRDIQLVELERWQQVAQLEALYLKELQKLNLVEPCEQTLVCAEKTSLPEAIECVVLAAVPDPSPVMLRALKHLAATQAITILVHAPPAREKDFDEWGRPLVASWLQELVDIPNEQQTLLLAGDPIHQSQSVLELISCESSSWAPMDMAIGVPDRSLAPFLQADLQEKGLSSYDPAGCPIAEHSLFNLLKGFCELISSRRYKSLARLLRHPDLLSALQEQHEIAAGRLLIEVDEFQNMYLPQTLDDVSARLNSAPYSTFATAVKFLHVHLDSFREKGLASISEFLEKVYARRNVSSQNPDDQAYASVAQSIQKTLDEITQARFSLSGKESIDLLLIRLAAQTYYMDRQDALLDLEGWLELPWNDAPVLLCTGMNEGIVPDSRVSDLFLPDSLRRQLQLRDESQRYALDIYLMKTLIESRRGSGVVYFVAGKTDRDGGPLRPSRLLFRCPDDKLAARVEKLFGEPSDMRENVPASVSFKLDPAWKKNHEVTQLHVTALRDYLQCPFRFYLKHVLKMEAVDDEKKELDALDFGSMVHYALQKMAQHEKVWRSADDQHLADFLGEKIDEWVFQRFGKVPLLPVRVQVEAAKKRLAGVARVQTALVKDGWEIVHAERSVETVVHGMSIRGKIDRIDRHQKTGEWRIIDYKTSDRATDPIKAHWAASREGVSSYAMIGDGPRGMCWVDLQLPLYHFLLKESGHVSVGYFNIPKAVTETSLFLWNEFDDKILASAMTCVEGVVRDIQQGRFWPPTENIKYDEFASLFSMGAEACVMGDVP